MDSKLKHLEFIQGVVNRLASDSFRMKGWSVALVVALFILLAIGERIDFVHIALLPVLTFWGLDGYFLWQERLFRALYDHVRTLKEDQIDFSMSVGQFRVGRSRTWIGTVFSRTLISFYGALVIMVVLAIAVN